MPFPEFPPQPPKSSELQELPKPVKRWPPKIPDYLKPGSAARWPADNGPKTKWFMKPSLGFWPTVKMVLKIFVWAFLVAYQIFTSGGNYRGILGGQRNPEFVDGQLNVSGQLAGAAEDYLLEANSKDPEVIARRRSRTTIVVWIAVVILFILAAWLFALNFFVLGDQAKN
jgi:hypothetical protein